MRSEDGGSGRQRSFIEEARRAQIVEAAKEAVAELGYARASLARIAERAGISKSVISYHFDGKSELLEQVARQYLDAAGTAVEARLAEAGGPVARIRAWVDAQLEYFTADRVGFLAMAEIVTNHRGEDGSRPFDGMDEEEIEILTGLLMEGQRAGEIRDLDPRAVAVVIQQTMSGLLIGWAHDGGSLDVATQVPVVVDFIEHAIVKEKT
ncbi:TetR family transcriptional regulator [Actinocorallia sp. API 0066]|uniref:TetR/AcrR family transcriptional regulator n=1 Tax=Actinocorallia sp. API 0066 TaxID=2896846 RepID=UPI001E410A28|nr:TetR family transcriptional regulator [Actinocorallia sp. API 0066]MCD0449178.1 TetR family transcriptional regulator [Actinocorallia sp. API 0066]